MRPRVLVVDRSAASCATIAELLGDRVAAVAPSTRAAASAVVAAARAAAAPFEVVLLDCEPEPTAAELRELAGARVLLIARDPGRAAALALRCGAADIVSWPPIADELVLRVNASAPRGERPTTGELVRDKRRPRKSDIIIGTGAWIKALYDRIEMVAVTDVAVAIFGESGTGKELVARTIHNSSPRHSAPFVVVNCAAIPAQLIEDELFGHVRGAFTDASRDRDGLLVAAHSGTLFLDEIGEMPLALQAKLLRVLQSQEFRRIGDDTDRRVDVRIITATNRNLEDQVASGSFREDLYYRINVFPMHLPPLRERPDDIPLLVHHFVGKYGARLSKAIDGVTPGALARLVAYGYPGNVRELENKVHQAMVIAAGPQLGEHDLALPPPRAPTAPVEVTQPFRVAKQTVIDAFERGYLTEVLRVAGGNLAHAARIADMDRKNLWALVVRHGLDRAQFKKG